MKSFFYIIICVMLIAGTGCGTPEVKPETDPKPDAFELARIINENSYMDVELLGVVGSTSGGSSGGDSSDQACVEAIPYEGYNGGVEAFAFPYPDDSDTVYWQQIYIKNDEYHMLGIHNGDDAEKIRSVMEEYGYSFEERSERVYTSEDCDHIDKYCNGDVHFSFYMNDDTLVFSHVSVHE